MSQEIRNQQKRYSDFLDAVIKNNYIAAEQMIKAGANVEDIVSGISGSKSMLMIAVQNDYFEMAELLLKEGADPNKSFHDTKTNNSLNVLEKLSLQPSYQINHDFIRLLVRHGADINKTREWPYQYTTLTHFVHRGDVSSAKLMIDLGAKLNVGKTKYDDALQVSLKTKDKEIIALIENASMQVTIADEQQSFTSENLSIKENQTTVGAPNVRVRL